MPESLSTNRYLMPQQQSNVFGADITLARRRVGLVMRRGRHSGMRWVSIVGRYGNYFRILRRGKFSVRGEDPCRRVLNVMLPITTHYSEQNSMRTLNIRIWIPHAIGGMNRSQQPNTRKNKNNKNNKNNKKQ